MKDRENHMPRIVTLTENNPYPRDVRVRPHMETLASAGYQVTVICPHARGQRWREEINNVTVYRFPTLSGGTRTIHYVVEFSWAMFVMTLLTLWVWMRHGLDVLHIYNPPDSLFWAGLLPKLAGKTIVFDLRDIAPELYQSKFENTSNILHRLLIWMERVMCQMADHIIVVNESYRRIVIERDRVLPENVSVVRQAPDIEKVKPVDPDPMIRSRAKTIIAYLGSMAGQDGIDYLFKSLHYLDKYLDHKDWSCALIGPAEDQKALEGLANQYGISDRIWFTGFLSIEEWVLILSSSDICVEPCPANPLNEISTMNKIMDYMALGKPIVAYDLPEHHFTAGESALYAASNDTVDFALQIAKLIENFDLRSQLGEVGRRRMMQLFAWIYQKQHLLDLYEGLIQKHLTEVNPGK